MLHFVQRSNRFYNSLIRLSPFVWCVLTIFILALLWSLWFIFLYSVDGQNMFQIKTSIAAGKQQVEGIIALRKEIAELNTNINQLIDEQCKQNKSQPHYNPLTIIVAAAQETNIVLKHAEMGSEVLKKNQRTSSINAQMSGSYNQILKCLDLITQRHSTLAMQSVRLMLQDSKTQLYDAACSWEMILPKESQNEKNEQPNNNMNDKKNNSNEKQPGELLP